MFGRPWLRTPRDRPAIELPPRKRARTARDDASDYDFDDQDDLPDAPRPRLLPERAPQEPSDKKALTEDSDDSEEWQDEEDDEGTDGEHDDASGEDRDEVAKELEYLRKENLAIGHHIPANNSKKSSADDQAIEARDPTADSLDLGALDGIVALRAAFPRTPIVAIEAELLQQHKDLRKAYDALSGSHNPTLSFDEMMEKAVIGLLFPARVSSMGGTVGGLVHQRPCAPRPLIQIVESSDKPEGAATALAHAPLDAGRKQDTSLRTAQSVSTSDEDGSGITEDTAYTAENIDASDETSSDGTDSSSDSASSSDDDSSCDESDSDSDSGHQGPGAPVGRLPSDESSSDDSDSDSDSSDDDTEASVGRQAATNALREGGQDGAEASGGTPSGRTKTQKRNARRRRSLARIAAENRRQEVNVQKDEAYAFEVRKQQLLRMVDETGDVGGDNQDVQMKSVEVNQVENDAGQAENGDAPSTTLDRRRSRVDLGAGRRLLFGSLGLKAPKTRAEEEKIKQGLMKDVRPLSNMRLVDGEAGGRPSDAAGGDGDDWRQQVTYRAVECSQPDIQLSEPPFPFEQRWDPQQRGRPGRKRKRTSQEFSQDYHGDDDSGLYMEEDSGPSKRSRSLVGDPFGLGEDEAAEKTPSSETEGRNATWTTAQADDVPPLPADISSLADLEAGEAKEGMVITWKQIAMSKATRWQPTVVQQTATVLGGSDETKLCVLLAMRDREDRSRAYDETGKRIYDKFEMPDADSDDEDEDDGERMVLWTEMMEPKIVRMPEETKQS